MTRSGGEEMGPRRLYLIQEMRAEVPTPRGPMAMSAGCYLVEMGDGTHVLVDTGSPPGMQPPIGATPERKGVVEQLAGLGVRRHDVALVVCTHFDGDHAGNHDQFGNAEFVVQREHYERARNGHQRFAAARSHWDHPGLRYRLVDGDTDLLPGVSLVETSGHTIGHQSVLVRLPVTGLVLLAMDAVAMESSFRPDREAGPVDEDADRLRASTRKLLDIAQREHVAIVVFHHDGRQWEQLKKAPDYYE
jgi:N-acyl homoserine lactone hydrolase